MIRIQKGQSNQVFLTLKELSTLASPLYLFKFTHEMTGETKIFHATDVSTELNRYNEFNIIESSTEDLHNGTVELLQGFHKYIVYEMNDASPADLDPDNAVGIVEYGKVFVPGSPDAIQSYDDDWTKNTKAYE